MLSPSRRSPLRPALAVIALTAALTLLLPAPAAAQDNPDVARGFAPDKVYQFGELDSVNLFNGNLTLLLPVGNEYTADGDLAYRLRLTYNSNIWRLLRRDEVVGGQIYRDVVVAYLEQTNAGPGWRLSLGELSDAGRPTQQGLGWVYTGEDGAQHHFYARLHQGESTHSAYHYSRDGSYLRLVRETSTAYRVEFPDGSARRFSRTGSYDPFRLDWRTPTATA